MATPGQPAGDAGAHQPHGQGQVAGLTDREPIPVLGRPVGADRLDRGAVAGQLAHDQPGDRQRQRQTDQPRRQHHADDQPLQAGHLGEQGLGVDLGDDVAAAGDRGQPRGHPLAGGAGADRLPAARAAPRSVRARSATGARRSAPPGHPAARCRGLAAPSPVARRRAAPRREPDRTARAPGRRTRRRRRPWSPPRPAPGRPARARPRRVPRHRATPR